MNLYRKLPKIDAIINNKFFNKLNRELIANIARDYLQELREQIANKQIEDIDENSINNQILKRYNDITTPSLKPLINATGIVIHTNLGRSPISEGAFEKAKEIACGYSNLEYNLNCGERGDRYTHTAKAISQLLGVEDALIVNNNAAAVFLILNTFAQNKEAIVSRGELVEIGGSFRVPEVMKASGAILKEIGTTNKTHLKDYIEAINEQSAILMKVHKSNYKIEGFTKEVDIKEISKVAKEHNLIDYYDLGSAYLPELPWGLSNEEPSIFKILKESPSLVSFSGDKLFGSVQAGIIVGKKELIAKLKKNQILRMFRVDKVTLAILEQTTLSYLEKEYEEIPTLKLLNRDLNELKTQAQYLKDKITLDVTIEESNTYVGGGTMPQKKIPTTVLKFSQNATKLEKHFRENLIIGRIENLKFILDMRTVTKKDYAKIIEIANSFKGSQCNI